MARGGRGVGVRGGTGDGKRRRFNYFRRQAQPLLGSRTCRSNWSWGVGVEVRWVGVRGTVTEGEEGLWLGVGVRVGSGKG